MKNSSDGLLLLAIVGVGVAATAVRVVNPAERRLPQGAVEIITTALTIKITSAVLDVARIRCKLGECNLCDQCKHFEVE